MPSALKLSIQEMQFYLKSHSNYFVMWQKKKKIRLISMNKHIKITM